MKIPSRIKKALRKARRFVRFKLVPIDAFVVPPGQGIYDPEVFGRYDLKSQKVVPREPLSDAAFHLDVALMNAQRHRNNTKAPLRIDRYKLVLDVLEPGEGVCLDACTPQPQKEVENAINKLGFKYRAIDIAGGENVRKEDLTNLSFESNTVSRIISLDTLEHIPDYEKAVAEMFRVLEPDGLAVVHVPCYYFDKAASEPIKQNVDPWGHLRYFSARELLSVFDKLGFLILRAQFNLDYGALLAVVAKPIN